MARRALLKRALETVIVSLLLGFGYKECETWDTIEGNGRVPPFERARLGTLNGVWWAHVVGRTAPQSPPEEPSSVPMAVSLGAIAD